MNAGSADTRFPHLDLGDLISEVTGRPISDLVREHLAGCEHCQREANRWNLVADGVRGLAAAGGSPACRAAAHPTAGTGGPLAARHAGGRLRGSRARPAHRDR
jgi:hypothetical protein